MSMRIRGWAALFILTTTIWAQGSEDISVALAEKLKTAQLADAETLLNKEIATDPKNRQAQFALGVVKVLSAIQEFGQTQYRFGALRDVARDLPMFRLPVPRNPDPQEVTYEQIRKSFLDFQTRAIQIEKELAAIDLSQEFKLPVNLAKIYLDLTGDGKTGEDEAFLRIFGIINLRGPGEQGFDLNVTFDNGDVPWLRGYCHFLAAFCDLVLAYDHQRLFDHCGQLVYPRHKPSTSTTIPLDTGDEPQYQRILDAITAIHLVNFPLKEPQRMESARQHFLQMIRTSRQSWELILKETDNDHEWLPNPEQSGALLLPVTLAMVDGWHAVLQEFEDTLEGRKLVPFWRDYLWRSKSIPVEGRGINLKKFFQEPPEFDLVLIVQGSGVLPYVERGKLLHPVTWNDFNRLFNGQLLGFAVWFN